MWVHTALLTTQPKRFFLSYGGTNCLRQKKIHLGEGKSRGHEDRLYVKGSLMVFLKLFFLLGGGKTKKNTKKMATYGHYIGSSFFYRSHKKSGAKRMLPRYKKKKILPTI